MAQKSKIQPVRPIFRYVLYALVASAAIYVTRMLWWASIIQNRPPSGPAFDLLMWIVVTVPVIAGLHLVTASIALKKTRNLIPLFVQILSAGFFFRLPFPPLPPQPPLPEETYFNRYRADYEK